MNRAWVGAAVFGVALVGCGLGGPSLSEKDFVLAGGARGWEAAAPIAWTAENYLATPLPSNLRELSTAQSTGESASWQESGATAERGKLKAELEEWWKSTQGPREGESESVSIADQFGIVIEARVLQSKIEVADGDAAAAFNTALETFKVAKSGFETAPEVKALALIPSVLVAARAVGELSQNPQVSAEAKEMALGELSVSISSVASGKLFREYFRTDLPRLYEQLTASDQAKVIAISIADEKGREKIETAIAAVIGSAKKPDLQKTGELANETMHATISGRSGFASLEESYAKQSAKLVESWGVDVLNVQVDDWDATKMKSAVSKASNPIGELLIGSMIRQYFHHAEYALVSQMDLDAAKIRVASEIVKQKSGEYPKSIDEFKALPGFRRFQDPLSGKQYEVDFATWTLRTPLSKANPYFGKVAERIKSGQKI